MDLREGLAHSFSLSSSSVKSLARMRAGSASSAPFFRDDFAAEEEPEGECGFGISDDELFIFLLAVCSVLLNIGVGLITLAVLMACMEDVVVFISFWAVWVDTRGDTLRGNIFCWSEIGRAHV